MNDELARIRNMKFNGFVNVNNNMFPVFEENNLQVIVGLKEYWSDLEEFCNGSDYRYFIYHQQEVEYARR